MYSWVSDRDFEQKHPSCRAVRGYPSACFWYNYYATDRNVLVGFRPAFDGLESDDLTPDENGVAVVGTLYMNGKPIRVPQNPIHNGDIQDYILVLR